MTLKIKIPKGWRRLETGTIIKRGDKFTNPLKGGFCFTGWVGGKVGWDMQKPPAFIYIRRIQSKKKGKK